MNLVYEAAVRRRRTIQLGLLGFILATLPLYCCGFLLWAGAPARSSSRGTASPTVSSLITATPTQGAPSITPLPLLGSSTAIIPIVSTPTQLVLPVPVLTATFTPTQQQQFATWTPYVILTDTPAPIIIPSATPIIIIPPTSTLPPTPTSPPPTNTVPPPTNTAQPPPTDTAQPAETVIVLPSATP